MYQAHWGLSRPPFASGIDTRQFYQGASQRESLARLRFLLAHRKRLGLILGEAGLGKSLVSAVFEDHCQQAGTAVARVDLVGLSQREFSWQIGQALQAAVRVEDDPLRLFRQLTDRLQALRLQARQAVLILDDLDQANHDLNTHVQRLLRTEAANDGWLTIVATANPLRMNRLGDSLPALVDLRIDMEPWDELDTIGFLQTALVEAGAERPLFDDAAMSLLHRLAGGVPRTVTRMADFALMAGSNNGLEQIDAPTIEAVGEAIVFPSLV